jgi:orotidine-5'-phosphate decarboxylase
LTRSTSPTFADRLVAETHRLGPLCVGIDPHASLLPKLFGDPTADTARSWGLALVEQCAGTVAVVKPQAGLFERWGSKGLAALEDVCTAAKRAGLIVILDAKRGDIGTTAEGYAEGYLADASSCPCDAITVNPYMGLDSLEPFMKVAERDRKGVVVLARTSNPGSSDFQSKLIDSQPLYLRVASALAPLIQRLKGEATPWSGLMLVAGATAPAEAKLLREAAPAALFLVPGYGAQGAGAQDAVSGFIAGANNRLEGGIVSASRSAACPPDAQSATSAAAWASAVAAAIAVAQAELTAAIET